MKTTGSVTVVGAGIMGRGIAYTFLAAGRTVALVDVNAAALDSATAAIGKMLTSEALCNRLDDLMQMHGGYGYMWEYPIARAWVDARAGRIAGGTGEIMREIIGRSLLGGAR